MIRRLFLSAILSTLLLTTGLVHAGAGAPIPSPIVTPDGTCHSSGQCGD